jgi:predicted anti-sigma-YlaC factor YlaD
MDELVCREVVEMVTDYLEGALSPVAARRFEEHLTGCLGCDTYLDQMRRTVGALLHLAGGTLPEATRAGLLAAFRDAS